LLVAPCEYGNTKNNEKSTSHYECTAREGVIIAGTEWLAELKPEVWTALATIAIAAFTGTLWWATLGTPRATNQTIRLTRKAFVAANRPKLIVRDVVVWQASTFESTFIGDFEGFKEGEKLAGHLVVVNVGGTDATIEFIDKMV
jgi:hypothetical protein